MKKIFVGLTVLAVCLFAGKAAFAALETDTVVTSTATVDESVEWASATYTIAAADFTAHITGVGQSITAAETLILYYNVDVTLTPTASVSGDEVLTSGTSDTLTTSYKLTSADGDFQNADADWVASATFIAQSYNITHTNNDGVINFDFHIKGASDVAEAADAGNYESVIKITAAKTAI